MRAERAVVVLCRCQVSYPSIHFATREMLHSLLGGSGRMSTGRRWVLTVGYYLTTIAAALVVRNRAWLP